MSESAQKAIVNVGAVYALGTVLGPAPPFLVVMSFRWADDTVVPLLVGVPLIVAVGSGLFALTGRLPGRSAVRGRFAWGALVCVGGFAGWAFWALTLASGDLWEGLTGHLVTGIFYAVVAAALSLWTLRVRS